MPTAYFPLIFSYVFVILLVVVRHFPFPSYEKHLALFGSDTYLLYWRVFVLLPDTHKLKKKYILYSYYVVLFLLLIFVTILFYVAGRHEHHEAVQRMLKVSLAFKWEKTVHWDGFL